MYTEETLKAREKFDNIVPSTDENDDFDDRPMMMLDGNFEVGDCFEIPHYTGTDLKTQRFGIPRGKTYEELSKEEKDAVNTTKCLYVPVWNESKNIKKADAKSNMKRLYASLFCRPRFEVNDNFVSTGKIVRPKGDPATDFQSTGSQRDGMHLLKGYVVKIKEMNPVNILNFNRDRVIVSEVPTFEYLGYYKKDGKKMNAVGTEGFKRPVMVAAGDDEEEESED